MSMVQTANNDVLEGEYESDVVSSTALAQLNASEIDVQIATANKYPRSIKRFKDQIAEFATLDQETAASMFYRLPRGGKTIEGPSIRLAEVAASSYKNLRFGSRVINVDGQFITAQGFCFDMEANIAAAVEVRRRITYSDGRKFNDDMIQTTGNAACSIALRNAIFKIIPMAFIKPAMDAAKQCAMGDLKTMVQRRTAMLEWYKKAGATEAQVFALLNVGGVDDIGNEELLTLNGYATAIKDKELTLETLLADSQAALNGPKVESSSANSKLKRKPETDKATDQSN